MLKNSIPTIPLASLVQSISFYLFFHLSSFLFLSSVSPLYLFNGNPCLFLQRGGGQGSGSCCEGLHGDTQTGGESSCAGEERSQAQQRGEG